MLNIYIQSVISQ